MLSILVVVGWLVSVFNKLSLSVMAFNKLVQVLSLLSKLETILLGTELLEEIGPMCQGLVKPACTACDRGNPPMGPPFELLQRICSFV